MKDKIDFIENYLEKKHPRDDYKELLELSSLFLGTMEKISFRQPGPCSNARWMSKAIYTLKMYLLRDVYNLADKKLLFSKCASLLFSFI